MSKNHHPPKTMRTLFLKPSTILACMWQPKDQNKNDLIKKFKTNVKNKIAIGLP